MILLSAILAGLAVGLILARFQKRRWLAPTLRKPWLVIVAFLPQLFFSYLPGSRTWVTDELAAAGLIVSLLLLLVFCWFNRQISGVALLALGLSSNLLVMAANGGFMPISPQTASHLVSPHTLAAVEFGARFDYKDILVPYEQTRLVWLSDLFLPPKGFPYQVAFSAGDLLIAAGAFWLLVSPPREYLPQQINKEKDLG